MASRLFNLVTKEISFCKKGAVPSALIEVYKSLDPPETDVNKKLSFLETTIQKIAKHIGIEKEIPIAKGLFTDAWQAKELRSTFYDVFYTLDDVVWGIMNNAEITDKVSQIKTAIAEFSAVAIANLPDETQVKKYLDNKEAIGKQREDIQKMFIPEPVKKIDEGGKSTMALTKEELTEVAKSVADILKEDLKTTLPEAVKKIIGEELKPVQEEVTKINTKVEEIGKMAPTSQQVPPDGKAPITKDFWNGVI